MSIARFLDNYRPECDYCEAELPAELSFRDALRAMYEKGWERRKVRGEWVDVCADCLFEEKGYANEQ